MTAATGALSTDAKVAVSHTLFINTLYARGPHWPLLGCKILFFRVSFVKCLFEAVL